MFFLLINKHQRKQYLNWKVATQLKHKEDNAFSAPILYYFMDSPTEISDYQEREFQVDGQTVKFVLHDPNPDSDFDTYLSLHEI